jgi:SAM-dependent methyltransferase
VDQVRFDVADLSSSDLLDTTGRRFDLVTCYGVISYIPDTASVFRNFSRALAPDGIVILGTNGAGHPSMRFRPVLSRLGIATGEFRESRRVREAIHVCDLLSAYPPIPLASKPAGFLAGDLFGPLNRALSLAEWKGLFSRAGLHLLGSQNAYFGVRRVLNEQLHPLLMPRSRAEVAELADVLHPASFHQLVLARREPRKAPWSEGRRLLRRRLLRTPLFKIRWPRKRGRAHELRAVALEGPVMRTAVTLTVPQWEIDVLQRADGERSLADLLATTRAAVPAHDVAAAMYLLYQLGVVNLLE